MNISAQLIASLEGIQFMLDEDIRSGLVDAGKVRLENVIHDRLLKRAQEELKSEKR